MNLAAGSKLGPYEILQQLGAGAMGEVYRAKDTRLGREIAIKVLRQEVAGDTQTLERFQQEARSASSLNHPNIVTIYDIGRVDSVPFIAMEIVDGQSLRQLLAAGPVPIERLIALAVQVAEALAAAHAKGIVHRDLKPENIMLSFSGLIKILDFGLAKLDVPGPANQESTLSIGGAPQTQAGTIVGTVGYMSSEQAGGHPVDFRSDQFSFGAILSEPFRKRPP